MTRAKQYGGATKEIQNAVGAGALDSPLYINVFSGRRRRRPLQTNKEIRRESIKICVPPVGEDIILPLSNKRHEQTLYQRTAYHYKP